MASEFVANGRAYAVPEHPMLAICADGWDPEYVDDALARRLMPRLAESLDAGGTYALGSAQVPTFTNPNNVAIVTGVSAAQNGIAGNHYRTADGGEVQVTDPSFLRAETIHSAGLAAGVQTLCVTAKDKLRALLATGGVPAFSAELAHEQALADGTPITDVIGERNPGIYDWHLSPYTIELGLALAPRLEARLVYASLTDYVQHAAAPGEPMADEFYRGRRRLDRARRSTAGFVVGLAADHGMKAKVNGDGSPERPLPRRGADQRPGSGAATPCARSPTRTSSTTPRSARSPGSTSTTSQRARSRARRGRGAARRGGGARPLGGGRRVRAAGGPGSATLSCSVTSSTVLGKLRRRAHDLTALHGALRSPRRPARADDPDDHHAHPLRNGALAGRRELRNRDLHDLLLNHVA